MQKEHPPSGLVRLKKMRKKTAGPETLSAQGPNAPSLLIYLLRGVQHCIRVYTDMNIHILTYSIHKSCIHIYCICYIYICIIHVHVYV